MENQTFNSNVKEPSKFNKFFKISERGSSILKELLGGLTIFLAMMYILPVNSNMLAATGLKPGAVFAATAIAAGLTSIIMGLVANYPVALAPGMGVNAFFTYTVVLGLGIPAEEALAAVLISGFLFLVISLTGLRKKVINAIPRNMKLAVGVGIGFFIAFIGFKNAGVIVSDPATGVALGDFSNPAVLLGLFGIVLVLILGNIKSKINHFAIIISMAVVAVVGLILYYCDVPLMPHFAKSSNSISDIKTTFGACFTALPKLLAKPEAYAVIFTFLFVDFFDTAGTLVAVGHDAGLIDEKGELKDGEKALFVDAVGTVLGATLGTSTVTSFVESTTGIQTGARTGLAPMVTGVLFLISLVAFPVFSIFDSTTLDFEVFYSPVTALALVMVGCLMFKQIAEIDFSDKTSLIAVFMTIIMMVLTYSIATGIAFGFITYVIVMLASRQAKKVNPVMYVLAGLFVVNFVVDVILNKM